MKRLAAFAVLLIVLAAPAWAGFDKGVAAYNRGDYLTALREWWPLAEMGDAAAQTYLGVMYQIGQGVPQNHAEAVRWYRKAAKQGNASAQFDLGVMYTKGHGVTQDYVQAGKWYRKAAAQGSAGAQYNLGVMYAKGHGVTQDYVQAHMWFNLAGAQGHKQAVKNRDIAAKQMTLAQIAEAERLAREWMEKHQRKKK